MDKSIYKYEQMNGWVGGQTHERASERDEMRNSQGMLRTEAEGFWLVTSIVSSPVFKRIPVLDGVVAVIWIPFKMNEIERLRLQQVN